VLVCLASSFGFEEITSEQIKSVDRGTAWLLKAQNSDGSWGVDMRTRADVSATACAGLALLSNGNTSREGPNPECVRAVQRATTYLLKRVRAMRPGHDIAEGESSDIQRYVGLRGHSIFALIFLSQVYGNGPADFPLTDRDELKRALTLLADTVAGGQDPDGSWYKDTFSGLQATAWAFQALRGANSAGIPIRHATIQKTMAFIRLQYSASTHMFSPMSDNGGNPVYASAAALRILYGMGMWNSPEYKKAADALLNRVARPPADQGFLTDTGEDFMAAVLITHALVKEGGPHWEQWFTFCRNRLLKIQNSDGSWTATSCLAGRVFPTAFGMLCLETPNRLLPLQDL
jgi:hypothetical protein